MPQPLDPDWQKTSRCPECANRLVTGFADDPDRVACPACNWIAPKPCAHCKGTGIRPGYVSHRATFDYIVSYEQFYSRCPSARALSTGLGFSPQTAYHRLRDLCDSGLLKDVGKSWTITQVGRDIFALGIYRQPPPSNFSGATS